MLKALQHSTNHPKNTFVTIHSDSTYTIRAAVSTNKPRKNGTLVHNVRKALKTARQKFGWQNVQMCHVQGHSDHPRNDVADELATRGLEATKEVASTNEPNARIT